MKFSIRFLVIFLTVFLSTPTKAQNVDVQCGFGFSLGLYACTIWDVTIDAGESATFNISGTHLPDHTNESVLSAWVRLGSIPFVITQLFTIFPNIVDFYVWAGGLERIQTNAFANAVNLKNVHIVGNNEFRVIQRNAFSDATNLETVEIIENAIETIHEAAFDGLTSVQVIHAERNQLRELPFDIFRTLTSLESIFLSDNALESLDGRLLANNPNVVRLHFARNQINAIGRNFLDGLTQLGSFNVIGNRCVDHAWLIGGNTTIDTVQEELQNCFDNFVDDDVKTFVLELRGSLVLRSQNGSEIIRL